MPQPWSNDKCECCGLWGPVYWSTDPIRRLCAGCHQGIVGPLPGRDQHTETRDAVAASLMLAPSRAERHGVYARRRHEVR